MIFKKEHILLDQVIRSKYDANSMLDETIKINTGQHVSCKDWFQKPLIQHEQHILLVTIYHRQYSSQTGN